jgi:type I restriction enzyme, S subunit
MNGNRKRDLPQLPPPWHWTTVGDLTEVIRGASPRPKGDPRYFGGEIPWIMIADVTRQPGKYLYKTREGVTKAGAGLSRLIPAGELILSNSGTVCVPKLLKVDGCIHDGFVAFPTLKEKVDLDFAYHWFEFVRPRIIQENRQGITQVNLNTSVVREMPFPFAPRKEQRRVVEMIEKQFTRLEAGVASLRRAQANLKRYRAAVLKAACEGKLVPTEAELHRQGKTKSANFDSGAELLARILVEWRKNWTGRGKYKEPTAPDTANLPPLPEGWTWASLDQLSSHITSGSRDWSQFYGKGTDSFILAQNIRPMRLDLSERQSVAAPVGDAETERTRVRLNDLLVTIVGAKTGDVCRVPAELENHFVCQSVALLRPIESASAKFAELYLASQENGQAQWKRYIYGQGRPHLSFDQLRMTALALPPLAEQTRIVAEVERRLSVIEELEVGVSANLQRATRLRQSILQKAFSGELVAQEQPALPENIVPLPNAEGQRRPNRHFARALLSAEIVHCLHNEPTFGRVKHQKIFHLCEHIARIEEIEGQYHREAAGPLDNQLIYANENELKKQQW